MGFTMTTNAKNLVSDLLPCPFCGGKAKIGPEHPELEGDAWTQVHCANAECAVDPSVECFEDGHKESAIRIWNTRAPMLAQAGDDIEDQRDALEDCVFISYRLLGGKLQRSQIANSRDELPEMIRSAVFKAQVGDALSVPVAWMCPDDPYNETAFAWPGTARDEIYHTQPLYTHPSRDDGKVAPRAVTDEMVEAVMDAYDAEDLSPMRAAIEAALFQSTGSRRDNGDKQL